jgi:GNAT superfamily N-acetyltransferase
MTQFTIRDLNPSQHSEIELVANRMRSTLVDVLGKDKGESLYSIDWLINRVNEHIDMGDKSKVILVESEKGIIVAHAIVRIDADEEGNEFVFFSTIYVLPESRKSGVASLIINTVDEWCVKKSLSRIIYNTATDNHRLIRLYEKHGYSIILHDGDMVKLEKVIKKNIL